MEKQLIHLPEDYVVTSEYGNRYYGLKTIEIFNKNIVRVLETYFHQKILMRRTLEYDLCSLKEEGYNFRVKERELNKLKAMISNTIWF